MGKNDRMWWKNTHVININNFIQTCVNVNSSMHIFFYMHTLTCVVYGTTQKFTHWFWSLLAGFITNNNDSLPTPDCTQHPSLPTHLLNLNPLHVMHKTLDLFIKSYVIRTVCTFTSCSSYIIINLFDIWYMYILIIFTNIHVCTSKCTHVWYAYVMGTRMHICPHTHVCTVLFIHKYLNVMWKHKN